MPNQNILAVITARGGSKRVPKKNLRMLGDQSLLERTVTASMRSKCVDHTIVSSDCAEIIEAARRYGCDAPFIRPSELATDDARSEDVLEHAIKNSRAFSWVLLLQPTSPFRTSNDIDSAFTLLKEINRKSCVGVTRIQPGKFVTESHLFNGDVYFSNSQEHTYVDRKLGLRFALNGSLYFIKTSHFLSTKNLVDPETVGMDMSAKKSLDIDTFKDLKSALELLEV